jgi:hypothetical protein
VGGSGGCRREQGGGQHCDEPAAESRSRRWHPTGNDISHDCPS